MAVIIAGIEPSPTIEAVNSNAVANTLQDITGLSFDVLAGVRYRFRFVIYYNAAITTTGARFTINGPAFTELIYDSVYTLTATTNTVNNGLTAYNQPTACNATSLLTGNKAVIEGTITPSANGTVIARFASEVLSSAVTVRRSSYVIHKIY